MITGIIYLIIVLVVYFLPAIIAYQKKKKNQNAITVANLFLGWTIIGWVVVLIWAVAND